jgi:hypothetical protein
MNQETIGKIEYLDTDGMVVDYTDYEDAEEFADDVRAELECGVSLRVTYIDDNGVVVSKNLMNDHDCLPKFAQDHTSGNFMKTFESSLEYLSKAFRIYDEPVEVKL